MSKVKFTVIFAAGAVAGAFGMYALNVALARDGGALATMEFARPPRKRPTKKRRRSDRQALPERRKGA